MGTFHKDRDCVIKDFCFPSGIQVQEINLSKPELETSLNEIIFCRQRNEEDCFLFTLNGNDYEKGIIYEDEYLNCIVLVIDDLISTDTTKIDSYKQNKAFCIMFRNHHYFLQYKLLLHVLQVIKDEYTKKSLQCERISTLQIEGILPEYDELINFIDCMINFPIITESAKQLLDSILELVPKSYAPGKTLSVKIPRDLGKILYKIPDNEPYLDIMWYGQFFINKIDDKLFYYLLTAVLLEKSIVFVSKDLNILTSIVNGFRILIRPFKWCHLFIAVLPKMLNEYIFAPQPMIIGMTDKNDLFEAIQNEACDEKICVDLDDKNEPLLFDAVELPVMKLNGLELKLKKLYSKFKKFDTEELRFSTYSVMHPEQKLSKDIAETIETTLDKRILSFIRKFICETSISKNDVIFDQCKAFVIEECPKDSLFIEQFVQTQMFAYYFDLYLAQYNK